MNQGFRTTDALFGKIAEDFASFNQAQLIDEGRFYKDITYIISILGIMWYRQAEEVIEVCDYRAKLPDDFKLLDSAYRCDRTLYDNPVTPGVVMSKLTFDHYPETQIPDPHVAPECDDCQDYWSLSKDKIFNRHEMILVQRSGVFETYRHPVLLRLGNVNTRKCHCTGTCANIYSTCDDTITIDGNRVFTNFKEGHIYLTYHAFPLDEDSGLPLIPDNDIIERCIEYFIKKNILENIWVNGDADVAQKIQYFDQMYMRYMGQAQYETKLPTFQTMVNNVRLKRKYLDTYQLSSNR